MYRLGNSDVESSDAINVKIRPKSEKPDLTVELKAVKKQRQ